MSRPAHADATSSATIGGPRTSARPASATAVDRFLAAHIERHVAAGDPERWLFPIGAGTPPHQNSVGHLWRKTTAAAGLNGFRLHDLRHFFASGLIAVGCDVVTVQRALGRASATTTLNTYGHLWPDVEDRTRAAAQALLADSRGLSVDCEGSASR